MCEILLRTSEISMATNTTIYSELSRRMQIWNLIKSKDNAQNISPNLLREEYRIYRGAA